MSLHFTKNKTDIAVVSLICSGSLAHSVCPISQWWLASWWRRFLYKTSSRILLCEIYYCRKQANLGAGTLWFQLSASWTGLCPSPLTSLHTPFPTASRSPFWERQQRMSALRRLTMTASRWRGLVDRRETNSTSPRAPSLLTTWCPQLLLAFIRWRWPTDRGRSFSSFRSSTTVSIFTKHSLAIKLDCSCIISCSFQNGRGENCFTVGCCSAVRSE